MVDAEMSAHSARTHGLSAADEWFSPRELQALADAAIPQWYAAQTCANHERRVADQLAGRAIETLLPTYESVRPRSDRKVTLQRPLFSGYVFVRIPLVERMRVLEVRGVAQLVSFGGRPAPLDEHEIAAITHMLGSGYRMEPHPYLSLGRRVRITSGPLRGLQGIIERQKNRARFVVAIDLISRAIAVEVTDADIEPQF